MERKEAKVDSTSVAFSPLETNSSTQTAYHQAAYPDQAVTKRCPAPASNLSRTRSRWDRPTQLGQLLNDTEGKKKTLLDKGYRLTTQLSSDRGRAGQSHVPPSPLCPTVGARGLEISQGVYVHVLHDRIEEEIEEEAGTTRKRRAPCESTTTRTMKGKKKENGTVDADPPRQSRTRWLAGSAPVTRGRRRQRRRRGSTPLRMSLQHQSLAPPSYERHNTNTRIDEMEMRNTKRRNNIPNAACRLRTTWLECATTPAGGLECATTPPGAI